MRRRLTGCFLTMTICLIGCTGQPPTPAGDVPLTLEQWRALPAASKYQAETFERLKLGQPALRDERAWQHFTRTVVLPAKQKDLAPARSSAGAAPSR